MNREEFLEFKIGDKTITYEDYKIHELKNYLRDTDYTIIKMYETTIQGGSIIEMLKEYKEVLSKRNEARQQINELEREVQNGN